MAMELLPFNSAVLPWLTGETLFSLCSRHHRLWGFSNSSQSTEILFGSPRRGTQHDFPCALDVFADRTQGLLGSANEIARQRTVLKFYAPFRGAGEVQDAVVMMRSASVAHLKYRLGLLTSRFRAHHPLKSCPQCRHRDLVECGWVYWRGHLQYPGVWMCPEHKIPVQESALKATGVARFQWHLPAEEDQHSLEALRTDWMQASALKLATMTVDLVESITEDGWLSRHRFQAAVRSRMLANGWLLTSGRLRLEDAASSFLQHVRPLRRIPELAALPSSVEEAKSQLGRLLRPMRSGTHPLRWMVVASWLFDDVDDLRAELAHPSERDCWPEVNKELSQGATDKEDVRVRLVAFMSEGASATSAAREYGVDVKTAMAWAASSGISTKRRSKKLTAESLLSILQALQFGDDRNELAQRYSISSGTITRILMTEVGLHAQWVAARKARSRERARSTWLSLLASGEHQGLKWMRKLEPAAYAWLYRNDTAWLRANLPPAPKESARRASPAVRWDVRDLELSARVFQTALSLSKNGATTLRLWQLYQVLPELKAKLGQLQRLPLTQRALETVLTRRATSTSPSELL
ncbi:hypothetical protein DY262_09665 [Hydrogenophaga borbori]|jgi:hypothetical protein|uniref:Uncharacterized protein n=2 Tax=Comamonadaceae TaxID=80864 RepID=A0A372EK46_9BURK|nr:TniQ family protein [Burkholderiales bacterium]RFP79239.1 hypothetical protein DY262_09665 [Hydrogenophaga borbori]